MNDDLVRRVERLVGAKLVSCVPVAGGYSPATRLLCRPNGVSFFVKAGATPLTSEFIHQRRS